MGVRIASVHTTTRQATSVAGNVETAVVTTDPLNLIVDAATVYVIWMVKIICGVTASLLKTRLRRGAGVTGVQLDVDSNVTVSGNGGFAFSGVYFDTNPGAADAQYSLCILSAAGSNNISIDDVCMVAMVL